MKLLYQTIDPGKLLSDMRLLVKEDHFNPRTKTHYSMYGLGPLGLSLVSTWNVEKMTKWLFHLTIAAVVISVIALTLSVIPFFLW